MTFIDDEPIVADLPDGAGKPISFPGGKVLLKSFNNNTEAPLEKTGFTEMIELTGSGTGEDRSGVDLVTVLDVSGSMSEDGKIAKMKTAMQFVIRKLSPIDRLSVVIFANGAARLCSLRQVTDKSRPEIEALVNALNAGGNTNIAAGLTLGLTVLKDRRLSSGRVAAIMLMSDGMETTVISNASQVKVDDVPVCTFGFGANHDPKVLKSIADNSNGGTFSDVQNQNNLSIAFSQCLAGLLTVVVQDLKITVAPFDTKSTVKEVNAGNYPQTRDVEDGSVTVSFGDLYGKEVRKVMVYLTLPEVPKRISEDILEISHSYKNPSNGKLFNAPPRIIKVTRTGSAPLERPKKEEVAEEESRIHMADMMKKAREMADKNDIEGAKDKLAEAENMLSDINSSALIEMLRSEIQQLMKLLRSKEMYEKKGRSFALSSETCHARQRYATRGDGEKFRMFATPRMDTYLDQAKAFDADPTKPIPSAQEDVKQEMAADPLATIAVPISCYLQAAIQALQAIDKIINKASP